jgi:hypothetical protein
MQESQKWQAAENAFKLSGAIIRIPSRPDLCAAHRNRYAARKQLVRTSGASPNHVTVTEISPTKGNQLLTPTIKNPVKQP